MAKTVSKIVVCWAVGSGMAFGARDARCDVVLLNSLNEAYLARHLSKEMTYWSDFMGLASSTPGAFAVTEKALRDWAADPAHLKAVTRALAAGGLSPEVQAGLEQWKAFFEVNARPDWPRAVRKLATWFGRPTTQQLFARLMEQEEGLAAGKRKRASHYQAEKAEPVPATLTQLRLLVQTNPQEPVRKAALESMQGLERFVLDNGLIPIVRSRNAAARRLGFADYYEWKVRTNERMTKAELFTVLDALEANTRDAAASAVAHFKALHGDAVAKPWNFSFLTQGDLTTQMDPYFPFVAVLDRFGRTFSAMGVDFNQSTLTMDLVDRESKYPNGFIRAPKPAYLELGENGGFRPALTHFASNAVPGQVGSGYRATATVFHEGGHHANFAHIRTPSVAGSQEESPTSVAGAETHSMFFDAVLEDPQWLRLYAKNAKGQPIPWALVEQSLRETHRLRALELRQMLVVPYMEKALYEMPESELNTENILDVARKLEQKLLFIEGSGRPVLSIPHIHSADSSAYYHGYVLAQLAVYMTRAFFIERDGHIVNNPKVGPDLAKAYWAAGNSISFPDMIRALTGKDFSADAAVGVINTPLEQYIAEQKAAFDRAVQLPMPTGPLDLNGTFTVAHGDQQIATTLGGRSFEQVSQSFAAWIRSLENP